MIRRVLRFVRVLLIRLALLALLLLLLRYSSVPYGEEWARIARYTLNNQFDFVTWEVNAIGGKVMHALYGLDAFMSETDRSQYVRDYMDDLRRVHMLEGQITAIYADPNQADPAAASADLRAERDTLRADLRTRQTTMESILEGQVAAILAENGFAVLGQVLPPVSAHFTEVPNLLVVSPRDTIRFDHGINLNGMTVDQQAELEAAIERGEDVSALVVPIGGVALYPAMILETTDIGWALDTIAHEWLHHYLFFFPLGLNYDFAGEARIINETTASLFGREVGRLALERYYPDLVPPPPVPVEPNAPAPEPPRFDFGQAMHLTRTFADQLLAQGQIEAAENWMEGRRALFVANGYAVRRINQAFFAFYGGYQVGDRPGVGGTDPIGPAVSAIRASSVSLLTFVETLRGITTRDELITRCQQLGGAC
jgi:hypothetical protein